MERTVGTNCCVSETAVLEEGVVLGNNVKIGDKTFIGKNSVIRDNCIIESNCFVGEASFLDYYVILHDHVTLGERSFVGARCILGEYLADFMDHHGKQTYPTQIGREALLRSETIIYGDNTIGDCFQTGHRVTIREKSRIGNHVRIGTLSDIQGRCEIGDYVSLHSNVHVGQKSIIHDYVWVFPYTVLTNDPYPPSEQICGVTIEKFGIVATGSILLPGVTVGQDALVGAGSVVNKDVPAARIVVGTPAKDIGDVYALKSKTTNEPMYPWRDRFDRGMPWQGEGYELWKKEQDASKSGKPSRS